MWNIDRNRILYEINAQPAEKFEYQMEMDYLIRLDDDKTTGYVWYNVFSVSSLILFILHPLFKTNEFPICCTILWFSSLYWFIVFSYIHIPTYIHIYAYMIVGMLRFDRFYVAPAFFISFFSHSFAVLWLRALNLIYIKHFLERISLSSAIFIINFKTTQQ